jgi:hypothetical protein
VSLLRQLRAGYVNRPEGAPMAVVLCGVRDVKDYRIHTASGEIITGGSAFNIKDDSLRLGDFTAADVVELYSQHTATTGQAFAPGVVDAVFELSQGQPWLVNALGREVAFRTEGVMDRSTTITFDDLLAAKERLILSRATHLDQLADKLSEPRVRRVIEPLLLGDDSGDTLPADDLQYCTDLGLIRHVKGKGVRLANLIYREVIPRELTTSAQISMETRFQPAWIRADGRLDAERLISEFQGFYLQEGEIWADRFAWREAGVQLLVQAFLQRVANGQGHVQREFPLGQRRADQMILWPLPDGQKQKIVIELKVLRWDRGPADAARAEAEGVAQAADYADRCGAPLDAESCHLLLCSRGPIPAGFQRRFRRSAQAATRPVTVWGM